MTEGLFIYLSQQVKILPSHQDFILPLLQPIREGTRRRWIMAVEAPAL